MQSCCWQWAISCVVPAPAQTLTTIYSFTGTNGDPEYPFPEGYLPPRAADRSGRHLDRECTFTDFASGADGRQPSMAVVFDQMAISTARPVTAATPKYAAGAAARSSNYHPRRSRAANGPIRCSTRFKEASTDNTPEK